MKFELKSFSPDAVYSSALEVGDFVPHFIIENDGRRLDIQVKAGEPLLLVFVSPWVATELLGTWLALQMPCAVYFISAADPGLKDRRLFWDAAVYRLFMQQDVEAGLFLCSPNILGVLPAHNQTTNY